MSNSVEKMMNNLETGAYKPLGPTDTFKFSCKCCGNCCTNRGDILLTPYDMYRMAKHLKLTPQEVIDRYCTVFLGSTSKLPLVAVDFKPMPMTMDKTTYCPFRKMGKKVNTYICGIHEAKPFVCAAYPLGRMTKITPDTDEYEYGYFVQSDVKCPGTVNAKEHTLEEWLSDFNLKESEEASTKWTKFLATLNKEIDFRKLAASKVVTPRTKDMIYSIVNGTLYLKLNLENEVLSELDNRFKETLEAVALVKEGARVAGIKLEGL